MGDAAQRVGVVERALQLGVKDRVGVAGFVAAGVADGLLAVDACDRLGALVAVAFSSAERAV